MANHRRSQSGYFTAVIAFLWAAFIAQPPARADFTFIHASDSHAGSPENARVDAAMFKEMAGLANKPAFVIVTGDIVDYGREDEYQRFAAAAKNAGDIPLYLAPGNHDVRWNPLGKEGYTRGTSGKLYQSWDYQNIHFVTLDSTVLLEHWGHISQEQLNWLTEDLKKVGNEKPVVIGFHHWIGRESVMVDNEAALLKVVEPYNVVLWLQGHGHADIEWNVNGVPATMVKGLYQGSYDVIDVTATEIRISKRFVPPDKNKELLSGAKQEGATLPEPAHRALMTVPLVRRDRPTWKATVSLDDQGMTAKVDRGNLPADAKLTLRVDDGKPEAFSGETLKTPLEKYSPGQHQVAVIATCANGASDQQVMDATFPGRVTPLWRQDIGGAVQSRLLADGGKVYVTSMGNDLVCLNAANGSELFRTRTGGPIFSSPELTDGTIYFGSADHFVYAVDASNGVVKWKYQTGSAVLAGAASAKGMVCIASCDTTIYGLRAADGTLLWKVAADNMFQSKTATDGEHFFVGGWDNHFRCIEAATGRVVWDIALGKKQAIKTFSAFAPAITHPCVGGGKVFVSTNDGVLHAITIADGKEAWKVDRKSMGYSSPCYHDGKVYFALSDQGDTYCANAETGEILWQRNAGSVIYDGGFCYADGAVYVGCVNGLFQAIDAAAGEIRWRYSLGPGHLLATPAADEKGVYIGSMNGRVFAFPLKAN